MDDQGCYSGGQAEGGGKSGQEPSYDASINDRLPKNAIRTSKYTWYTFLPKNLLAQFSKSANAYFLFICVG